MNLTDELRSLREAAPPRSQVLTVHMFGINRYQALKNLDGDEWRRIISDSGLKPNYLHELWRGFCLSQYVSVDEAPGTTGIKRRGTRITPEDEDRFMPDLKAIERSPTDRITIISSMLFGIRYSQFFRGSTEEYKRGVLASAGIKPSYANELRKGVKLGNFVSFKAYPSAELDDLIHHGEAAPNETNRRRITADREANELRMIITPMVAEGLAVAEIVRRLNQMDIRPRRGENFHYWRIYKLAAQLKVS